MNMETGYQSSQLLKLECLNWVAELQLWSGLFLKTLAKLCQELGLLLLHEDNHVLECCNFDAGVRGRGTGGWSRRSGPDGLHSWSLCRGSRETSETDLLPVTFFAAVLACHVLV